MEACKCPEGLHFVECPNHSEWIASLHPETPVTDLMEAYMAGHYAGAKDVIDRLRLVDPTHVVVRTGDALLPIHPYMRMEHTIEVPQLKPPRMPEKPTPVKRVEWPKND